MSRSRHFSSSSANRLLAGLVGLTLLIGGPTALAQVAEPDGPMVEMPPMPETPLSALDIVLVRTFVLAQPYESDWGAERPSVRAGALLVVDLPADATVPRQLAEPVLMVGNRVAERLHVAWPNGRAVIIVPADVDRAGNVVLRLDRDPIWFAAPELPERVDAAWIATERDLADRAGITPMPEERVAEARKRGGQTLQLADRRALLGAAALLIREFVPDQDEAAEAMLLNAMSE